MSERELKRRSEPAAAMKDGSDPAKDLFRVNDRILTREGVATSGEAVWSSAHNTMNPEAALAAVKDKRAHRQRVDYSWLNGEEVARPDRREHAGTADAEVQAARHTERLGHKGRVRHTRTVAFRRSELRSSCGRVYTQPDWGWSYRKRAPSSRTPAHNGRPASCKGAIPSKVRRLAKREEANLWECCLS